MVLGDGSARASCVDSFDTEEEYREVLLHTLQNRIQEIVTWEWSYGLMSRDNPNTNNVAVLIVHESFMSQYKKELDAEQKQIADLKKQLETSSFGCGM